MMVIIDGSGAFISNRCKRLLRYNLMSVFDIK